jgi:hypothetical protein
MLSRFHSEISIHRKMSSTNPLEKVCVDLHELIFQHLDKSDLKASEVSPEWNDAISKSAKCMSLVFLDFNNWIPIPQEIMESDRQYSDLRIKFSLKNRARDQACVRNTQQMIQLVQKLSSSLKNLKIENKADIFFKPTNLEFPKLESLEIITKVPNVFEKVTTLKKLSLKLKYFNRAIIDWIEKQEKLEELYWYDKSEKFFKLDPKAPKGIKRFGCDLDSAYINGAKFNNFLEPICKSLTYLSIGGEIHSETLELIVNEMPKLKTLILCQTNFSNFNNAKLTSNVNIAELQIFKLTPDVNGAKFNNFLEPICKSLTYLSIGGEIHSETLELIVNEMPKLKTLILCQTNLSNFNNAKLKSNVNIAELQIFELIPNVHCLLLSLASLESLTFVNGLAVTVAKFEWIARNLMKLKKLSWAFFNQSNEKVIERYNEMKANEEGINMDIVIE